MANPQQKKHFYEFGETDEFRFYDESELLFKSDERIHLSPKDSAVLKILLANHGDLVKKEDFMRSVWAPHADESNLSGAISRLRKALGGKEQEYIETLSTRGFRFQAEVRDRLAEPTGAAEHADIEQVGAGERTVNATPPLAASARAGHGKRVPVWLLALGSVVVVGVPISIWLIRSTGGPGDPSIFGFEEQAKPGQDKEVEVMWWRGNLSMNATAVVDLRRSTEVKRFGDASLMIDLDFQPQPESKRHAEVAIDFIRFNVLALKDGKTQEIEMGPAQNLAGKTISAYIRFGRDFAFDPAHPPGVRLFLIGEQESEHLYGCWTQIASGTWIPLSLSTGMTEQQGQACGGTRSRQFDPARVRRIGVSIDMDPNSPITYKGACFLDAVTWPRGEERR